MVEVALGRLLEEASKDQFLVDKTRVGLCRLWSEEVLRIVDFLQCKGYQISGEAREVELDPGLYHTFLRINTINEVYLWDGAGSGKHRPYFGLESEAPEHLKDSSLDMISRIRQSQSNRK